VDETYDPQAELDKFNDNLPPLEDLPGGEVLAQFPDFPLSTHDGLVAAWSFINDPENQARHDQAAVDQYKQRIQMLARHKGVDLGNV
jgi:hypothetical protein